MVDTYNPRSEADASAKADADPRIVDNTARFRSCSAALDTTLRERNITDIPKECSNLSWATPKATSE